MSRQYNTPDDLYEVKNELETLMQEQEMKQSGSSIQKFKMRTMYKFYPNGGCSTNLLFNSNYMLNIKNNDEFCLLCV